MRLQAGNINDVHLAAQFLRNGQLVALPTETVYGLAANGLKQEAIQKVYQAKNRPLKNPLILHVNTVEKAAKLFDFSISTLAKKRFDLLQHAFWPGALTIIGPKASFVPYEATAHLSTVAVRIPNHKVTNDILHQLDFPLIMPSANLSTRPSPTSADHVLKTLNGRIDAVVDDGYCSIGVESTVVKIDAPKVILLRPGIITKTMIEICLNEPVDLPWDLPTNPISPGQFLLHYSPRMAFVGLLDQNDIEKHWQSLDIILAKKSDLARLNQKCGMRLWAKTLALSDDPCQFAHALYNALYECEEFPDKKLWIVLPTNTDETWAFIIDRLKKSAGFKDI